MYLGTFPADSTFIYLGFYIFSVTYKVIQPLLKIFVIGTLFFLVWRVLKTGDWLHSVGGYLLYVILLIALLSHTTTISLANIRPRSKQTKPQTVQAEALRKLALGVSSVRVPTVFLFSIRAIDTLTNNLADIISKGHYFSGAFEFIHAQAILANLKIVGRGKGDYINFCIDCFSKARTDVRNGKYILDNGRVLNPGFQEDWYLGHRVYKKLYKNHKIIWNGKEMTCLAAYEQLNKALIKNLKDTLRAEKIEKIGKGFWGKSRFGKWCTSTIDSAKNWGGSSDALVKITIGKSAGAEDMMLFRILKRQYYKLKDDTKANGKIYRELDPGDRPGLEGLAKLRGTGLLGAALPVAGLLAKVSLFIRLAPLVQGACLCLCIGAFPFLILLSLFPRAIRVLKTAFLFIFQVSMWTVCWAIVDLLSRVLPALIGGGFAIERIDIPIFVLLMYIVAPILSMIFIKGQISTLGGMLAVPAGNPVSAINAAKGAGK